MKKLCIVIAAAMLLAACTKAQEPSRHWKAVRNTGTCIVYIDEEGSLYCEPIRNGWRKK